MIEVLEHAFMVAAVVLVVRDFFNGVARKS